MKLVVAAFWIEDETSADEIGDAIEASVEYINDSGEVVTFDEAEATTKDFRWTLWRLNLERARNFPRVAGERST